MKTLIAIIENYPSNKSAFGSVLSKETGIPLFDVKQYLAMHANEPSGEQKALDELKADMFKHEAAILNHTGTTTALKISQNFNKTICFLSDGQNNSLAYRCFNESKHGSGIKKNTYPDMVKYMAENLKKMNPVFVLPEWNGSADYLVWKIKQNLSQK